jgi:hypothetical protein
MGKIISALLLAAVTAVTGTAHATRLTITDGNVLFYQVDTSANFSGDGFSVSMFSGTGSDDIFSPFTGPASITIGLPICCGGAHVDVGGVECFSTSVHDPPCGTMTLMTSEGLPPRPADWPVTEDFVSTVPFTAMGHLDVGGGFDIVGHGILAGTVCGRNTTCDAFTTPILRHGFSVPEASTLLLLVTSLGVLVVLQCQRAARSVSKAEPFSPWAPTYRALRRWSAKG